MGTENFPKPFIRLPNTWGIKAANRLEERISSVHNRLGFDPNRPWNLFSLETYKGKINNLRRYVVSYLLPAISYMAYQDRTTITWIWPLPGDSNPSGVGDSIGILRILHLPPGTKKPDDLVRLELIDVHSQLLGRIGFEFLRLEELLSIWKFTAERKQSIGAASMSRNLIEATASLYALAGNLAEQWSKCKMTSGKIYKTATGGRVDRERAVEVDRLRKLLWSSRNELRLHDVKESGLNISLGEWRNPDFLQKLQLLEIEYRQEVTFDSKKSLMDLVRLLSKRIKLINTSMTLMHNYELLCNIVHPSVGSFQLFSGRPETDLTHGFHNIFVGKNRGRPRIKFKDPSNGAEISAFGIFSNAISESMFIAGNVYISILEFMTAIGDDIALTANIEPLSFHKTWHYPKALKGAECLCTWKELGGCDHSWGVQGPQIKNDFDVDLRLLQKRSENR